MRKERFAALLVLMIAALSVSGCGASPAGREPQTAASTPAPASEPEDRAWYAVATELDDCVLAKLAFGLDTPEQVLAELNRMGGRYTYLRQDDFMVAIIEPMGAPIFFVRGRSDCRKARALAFTAG